MQNPRQWRKYLGFERQDDSRRFLQAKDIPYTIDLDRLSRLNDRMGEILTRLNTAIHSDAKHPDIELVIDEYIRRPFERINGRLEGFNNYGRHPEDVYWKWIQGHAISGFLRPSIAHLLSIDQQSIRQNGDDDPNNPLTFFRSPAADLKVSRLDGCDLRIEVQSGFQKKHDIKKHKVDEAIRRYEEDQSISALIHFDALEGRLAVVALHKVDPNSPNWEQRREMENQTVLALKTTHFQWSVTLDLPDLSSPESWAT